MNDEIKELVDVLAALGVFPDGYCWCSINPDPHKPEEEHQGECREARAVMRKYESEKFAYKPKVDDSLPTTKRFIEKPHGAVGYEIVGNKIVERWDVPDSFADESGLQALSDVARCKTPKDAQELCDLLNDGRKIQKLVDFLTDAKDGEHACDAAIRIIERQAHDYQNLVSEILELREVLKTKI